MRVCGLMQSRLLLIELLRIAELRLDIVHRCTRGLGRELVHIGARRCPSAGRLKQR